MSLNPCLAGMADNIANLIGIGTVHDRGNRRCHIRISNHRSIKRHHAVARGNPAKRGNLINQWISPKSSPRQHR